jgi:hypothetical protein
MASDRHLRPPQRAEEGQAVHAHQPADSLRMLLGQHQSRQGAHRMTDHRRPLQPLTADVAVQFLDHRLDEGAVAMTPGLAGEARQLHEMDPVRRLQPIRRGPPHFPRTAEAGDQDHIGARPHHLHGQAVRDEGGRLGAWLGEGGGDADHQRRGADRQTEQCGAQARARLEGRRR